MPASSTGRHSGVGHSTRRGAVRAWLRELVRFRAGARSYAVIIGFPIALALVTNGLFALTGGDLDVAVWDERLAVYIPALIIWTIAAVGEEPGWRGFALPRLQERLSPVPRDPRARRPVGALAPPAASRR